MAPLETSSPPYPASGLPLPLPWRALVFGGRAQWGMHPQYLREEQA